MSDALALPIAELEELGAAIAASCESQAAIAQAVVDDDRPAAIAVARSSVAVMRRLIAAQQRLTEVLLERTMRENGIIGSPEVGYFRMERWAPEAKQPKKCRHHDAWVPDVARDFTEPKS